MVAGLANPLEAQLLRQSDRSFIRGSNDGPDARRLKIGLSPLQRRSACLGSDPLAMAIGSHDPAHLRLLTEFGFQVAPRVEKADDVKAQELVNQFGIYDHRLDLAKYQFPHLDLLENHGSNKISVNAEELEANKNKIVEIDTVSPKFLKIIIEYLHNEQKISYLKLILESEFDEENIQKNLKY